MKLKPALVREPLRETSNAIAPAARLRQVERGAGGGRVGDEPALVALPPVFELEIYLAARDRAHFVDQLEQADGVCRSTTEVECAALHPIDALERTHVGVDRVGDVEDVAHLPSAGVNRDRRVLERAGEKMRDPALVLG